MKNSRFYRYCSIATIITGLSLSGVIQAQSCSMGGAEGGPMGGKGKHGEHQCGCGGCGCGSSGGGANHMGMFKKMLRHVDLTDEQSNAVKSIMEAASPEHKALADAMKRLRHSDMSMLPNGFDEVKVEASAQAHADIMKQMMVLGARVKADLFAVLTPDQQAQLMAKHAQKMDKMRQGDGTHGEHGSHEGH